MQWTERGTCKHCGSDVYLNARALILGHPAPTCAEFHRIMTTETEFMVALALNYVPPDARINATGGVS
jgi:hypothetical protein